MGRGNSHTEHLASGDAEPLKIKTYVVYIPTWHDANQVGVDLRACEEPARRKIVFSTIADDAKECIDPASTLQIKKLDGKLGKVAVCKLRPTNLRDSELF